MFQNVNTKQPLTDKLLVLILNIISNFTSAKFNLADE